MQLGGAERQMTTPDSLLAEESTTGSVIESDAGASVWGKTPALTVLAICAVILLLRYMQEVFIPFVLAGLTFYALDPMVDWLQRWRVPRSIGAALMLSCSSAQSACLGTR